MSDIVKDVYSSLDKFNFLTSTKNLTKLLSKSDTFANEGETDEKRNKRICHTIIAIKSLFIIAIAVCLFAANHNGFLSDELFIVLSLLTLLMPDIVFIIMLIIFIVNRGNMMNNNSENNSEVSEVSGVSDSSNQNINGDCVSNKYVLTTTPDIFTN